MISGEESEKVVDFEVPPNKFKNAFRVFARVFARDFTKAGNLQKNDLISFGSTPDSSSVSGLLPSALAINSPLLAKLCPGFSACDFPFIREPVCARQFVACCR